jgi:hypothetical protein
MERDPQQLDFFLHALAAAVAMGVAAYLSEGSSQGFFPLVAASVAFCMTFAFLQLLPRIRVEKGSLPWMSRPTPRQLVLFGGIAALAIGVSVTDSEWREEAPALYEWIELIGFLLIVVCVVGQHFYAHRKATLTMGLFGCLGAAGVGAQSGELTMTLMAFVWGIALFVAGSMPPSGSLKVVRISMHPAYRWWYEGRPALRTWVTSALLLSSVPLAELAERLQAAGYLPIIARLP